MAIITMNTTGASIKQQVEQMTNTTEDPSRWWGKFEIPVNASAQWQIEPLSFGVQHLDKEWRISHQRDANDDVMADQWSFDRNEFVPENYSKTTRYVFRKSSSTIEIKPQLADRTIVTRPATPISLVPGEEVVLYVSTPLWIQFEIGGQNSSSLDELAIHRPSDTWFGPSTCEGELCYASKTNGRINLENMLIKPNRAITPLIIRNLGTDKFLLERVALPVPLLSLFATANGQLWTQPATLIREDSGGMAELKLGKDAPKEAKDAVRINKARLQPEKGMFVRAFSAMFDKGN